MAVPYYNVGTATLTAGSATMTGQGTLWVGNVRPGDQVVSYAGETAIVGTVDSNTSITLARAFRGTSQAAAAYEIIYTPDDPYTQTLARQVLQAISGSALVGLSGLVPAARKLPYFGPTGAAALTDLSDFARTRLGDADLASFMTAIGLNLNGQSNAPIRIRNSGNALEFGYSGAGGFGSTIGAEAGSGKPFLIFFAEAGTGSNTYRTRGRPAIGVRGQVIGGGLDFIVAPNANADNQLATVIASLDPDGSFRQNGDKIIDAGVNANGSYIRFAGGMQICSGTTVRTAVPANLATGSSLALYRTASQGITFPASFVDANIAILPTIFPSPINYDTWVSQNVFLASNTASYVIISGTSRASIDFTMQFIASGRWK